MNPRVKNRLKSRAQKVSEPNQQTSVLRQNIEILLVIPNALRLLVTHYICPRCFQQCSYRRTETRCYLLLACVGRVQGRFRVL
ncbi:hypothetical protein [Dulcicalothrix desertica]|uniref:hypothetical protein n=1 Tax=Dulcicalothrix desertica TaxID=32056 RepID=UPI000F8DF39A|nr:hypothetical protein [Dulcicalothrix desertica]